ncbi:right-handed parallel beta-helix repeat-containing protein [Lentzea flava]|uniref:right-handed parallel beta-helix repeat-containing protein n=1 Tax=Lentzea flava TaxID=103732 RepID=UPI00167020E8|nr:right-handed parallel beta-helix repeat-containing protein [Lentzea flava]
MLRQSIALTADLECPGVTGLVIGANGVNLDLNGHRLNGSPALSLTGVDGTTIRNGTIPGNIVAADATSTRFVDMAVGRQSSNAVYDWTGTTSVTFLRSKLDMWRLFCGARCHLLRSTFTMNQIGATHLIIQGDQGQTNWINHVGAVQADIVNTRLNPLTVGGSERLTIRDSELDGFEVIATGRLELLRNTFSGGNWLGVHRPVNGVIRGNRFEKMKSAGLFVDPKETLTGPLVIERNTFADNAGDGLRIDIPVPLDITVRKNTSENNGQYGMWATAGTVKDGGKNVSNNDALGCFTIVCS